MIQWRCFLFVRRNVELMDVFLLPREVRSRVVSLLLSGVKIERDQHIVSSAHLASHASSHASTHASSHAVPRIPNRTWVSILSGRCKKFALYRCHFFVWYTLSNSRRLLGIGISSKRKKPCCQPGWALRGGHLTGLEKIVQHAASWILNQCSSPWCDFAPQDGGLYGRLYLGLYELIADLLRLANGDDISRWGRTRTPKLWPPWRNVQLFTTMRSDLQVPQGQEIRGCEVCRLEARADIVTIGSLGVDWAAGLDD